MKTVFKHWSVLLSFAALCVGTGLAHADNCVGTVITPPEGMVSATDATLLKSAIGDPGKGGLCTGKVFTAQKAVTVYRVWDASKSSTLYGRWWSFDKPAGTREAYRVANGICPEWSPLNKMSSCTITTNAKVVVGPGQSAQCENSLLPASAVNQVYIPNDSRNNVLFVENCTEGVAWP